MKTNTARLPLILRREPFGGLLFDPTDGTMLELDHAATKVVAANLKNKQYRLTKTGKDEKNERELLARVRKEVRLHSHRAIHTIDAAELPGTYSFNVLSAPTLLDFQITTCCYLNCSHCYANATPEGKHVRLEDIEHVIREASQCGVCQLALGGGEPLLHPQIPEILAICHEQGIVPNLSTSGMHFTKPLLKLLKKYCGAVAISLENTGEKLEMWRKIGFEKIREALQMLKNAHIPTVIQVTLSAANFHDLPAITDFCLSQAPLYGVIFLAYKPVGRGEGFSAPLASLDPRQVSTGLQTAFHRLVNKMRVGYDCCLTPALAGFIHPDYLEGCSALRGSAGISPALDLIPCTFLPQRVIGNLKKSSLADIWRSSEAQSFRDGIAKHTASQTLCQGCDFTKACLAGCPAMELVKCSQPGQK